MMLSSQVAEREELVDSQKAKSGPGPEEDMEAVLGLPQGDDAALLPG